MDVSENRALRLLYERGQRHWKSLPALDFAAFAAHVLGQQTAAQSALAERSECGFASLLAEDLYLAFGCLCGIPEALSIFEREYLKHVPRFILRVDTSPAFADEVLQLLRQRLLLRELGARARIGDYAGRGALASWLRVAAVRVALNHKKSTRPQVGRSEESLADEIGVECSAELKLLRERHSEDFAEALRGAVNGLGSEQRGLLRMYFVAGQSTDRIAGALGINRSTAARRLVAIRETIYEETKRRLRQRLALATPEFESLARALGDQVPLSLCSLLGASEARSL